MKVQHYLYERVCIWTLRIELNTMKFKSTNKPLQISFPAKHPTSVYCWFLTLLFIWNVETWDLQTHILLVLFHSVLLMLKHNDLYVANTSTSPFLLLTTSNVLIKLMLLIVVVVAVVGVAADVIFVFVFVVVDNRSSRKGRNTFLKLQRGLWHAGCWS